MTKYRIAGDLPDEFSFLEEPFRELCLVFIHLLGATGRQSVGTQVLLSYDQLTG
jgi:hypothetical protein